MEEGLTERLVSSSPAFAGALLRVRVDRVEVSQGVLAVREVVEHPGSVVMVPLQTDGQVVMIRQYRHAVGEVLWELPAGTLRAGEAPEDCARRELTEEIGYQAGDLQRLFSLYLAPGYCTELTHVYLARDLRAARAGADPDERIRPVPVPLEQALAMVERGEVRSAQAVCGLLACAGLVGRRGNE